MSAGPLAGRVALVTGGGRGIGRASALALARCGARVLAVARTEAELDALAAEHPEIEVGAIGLETAEGCAAAVQAASDRLGPVDVLVANAGIGSARERPIHEQDPSVWAESLAINLHAPFHLMRLVSPGMVERRWGRVIVVASTAGLFGGPSQTAYCASKHGAIGLVRAAAVDLARYGVTCNAICPGWVRTAMADRSAEREAGRQGVTAEEVWAQRAASYPAGRVVEADEVAATVAFLAGPEASGISGDAVTVALGSAW